ncbi:hypothetical protein CJ030_MR0G007675 [Morella rubra]|uniref:Malectin-like domain-containing protein n=1 Tax=Morella rubra TaxID=262757 RepID=A0A6A1UMA6_9ROSI|nr:hypothetical protein CJ030_MR0G007675 [Morella rubra]
MVLFPLLLLQFHSVLLVSSSNFIPGKYFINCGTKSDLNVVYRHVVGDPNNDTFSVGPSSTVSATNSDTSLHDNARIFTNQTSFDFSIDEFGIFYVRLHFFPFASGSTNLADALFDVSASNFSLLSDFGVKTNDALPVIKEYLLTINETLFSIHFTPQQNSFAFLSAIEVFLIPDPEFVMDDEIGVSSVGKETRFHGLRSQVFHTLHRHRVNIGGPQNNDSFWRNWIPDDRYLVAGGFAKTCFPFTGKYFINCGTKSDLNVVYRHVVGDPNNDTFSVGPSSTVFHTLHRHRVNIGGPQNNDSGWIPDDRYLVAGGFAKTCFPFTGKYFINCGSKLDLNVEDRHFVGDLNKDTFSVGPSSTVSATNSDTSLYDSARIFTNETSFDFSIDEFGIFYVRLHFFPFASGSTNLADALFDVSASNFSLLSNFGVKTNDALPVIKEYLLTINATSFSIHFTPQKNSFAFVSAIEVFLIPDPDFVMDEFTHVTPIGQSTQYYGVRSQVLHTIHRVNIGGPQNNDSLWRNWIPDDRYLEAGGGGLAKTCVPFVGTLHYDVMGANVHSASDIVYRTCREMKLNQSGQASVSDEISWRFDVSRNSKHLVRVHFCDIVSLSAGVFKFNLYIYDNFFQPIDPSILGPQLAAPYYWTLWSIQVIWDL